MHAPDENVQSANKWSSQVSQKLSSYSLRWAGSRLDSLDYWNFLLNELNDRNRSLRKVEVVLWLSKSAGSLCRATTKSGKQIVEYTATILWHNISTISPFTLKMSTYRNNWNFFYCQHNINKTCFYFLHSRYPYKYVQKLTLQ